MKWKTKSGEIIPIREMSDQHLKNAYNYCGNILLLEEARRRHHIKFFETTKTCENCACQMPIVTIESREVGWQADKYRYECKCGVCSAFLERPYFNAENWQNEL